MQYLLPNPNNSAPLRRPTSVRRTTTLVATWPEDRHGTINLEGLARDIYTKEDGVSFEVLGSEKLLVSVDKDKHIAAISAQQSTTDLSPLIGISCFSELRRALDEVLAPDNATGGPLYQLVHDMTGLMIASDWAWASRPLSNTPSERRRRQKLLTSMAGACMGLAPGTSSQFTDGLYQAKMAALVPPLRNEKDPQGWHEFAPHNDEISLCRARRLDVWLDNEKIMLDTSFQDSASTEEGIQRKGVHEYRVRASFDSASLRLTAIEATPHLLPFRECPGAVENLQRLLGTTAEGLRAEVSIQLRKTHGCTHLNDAARALASAPAFIDELTKHQLINQ